MRSFPKPVAPRFNDLASEPLTGHDGHADLMRSMNSKRGVPDSPQLRDSCSEGSVIESRPERASNTDVDVEPECLDDLNDDSCDGLLEGAGFHQEESRAYGQEETRNRFRARPKSVGSCVRRSPLRRPEEEENLDDMTPQRDFVARSHSTPKPQKRRSTHRRSSPSPSRPSPQFSPPARQSPMKTPVKVRAPQRRSSSRRANSRIGKMPQHRSPLREHLQFNLSTGTSSASRRPAWDFTHSDMSRYKLSPAEQLRRHLLRISRHQDHAAVEVQSKLKQMQENIAPFVHETEKETEKSSRMTSCFASRVPTGRLPEDTKLNAVDVCGAFDKKGERSGNVAAAFAETPLMYDFPGRPRVGTQCCQLDNKAKHYSADIEDAYDEDARLSEALEQEINTFFDVVSGKGDPSGFTDQPQYRRLRRAPISGKTETRVTSIRGGSQGSRGQTDELPQFPLCSSDSDLGEVEDDANMLEAQLEWWRWHKETLLKSASRESSREGTPRSDVPFRKTMQPARLARHAAGAREPLRDYELDGRSDWLNVPTSLLPLPSAQAEVSANLPLFSSFGLERTTIEKAAVNHVAAKCSDRVDQFMSQSAVSHSEEQDELTCGSLSKLISEQAEELLGSTLAEPVTRSSDLADSLVFGNGSDCSKLQNTLPEMIPSSSRVDIEVSACLSGSLESTSLSMIEELAQQVAATDFSVEITEGSIEGRSICEAIEDTSMELAQHVGSSGKAALNSEDRTQLGSCVTLNGEARVQEPLSWTLPSTKWDIAAGCLGSQQSMESNAMLPDEGGVAGLRRTLAEISPPPPRSNLAAVTLQFAREWAGELSVDSARGHTAQRHVQPQSSWQRCDVSTAPSASRLEIRSFDELFNV